MSVLVGCLLFMTGYAFYHYRLSRDQAFFYYSLYASCGLINLVQSIDYQFHLGLLLPHYPTAMINPFNMSMGLIFYSLFLNKLIYIREHFPRIWRVACLLMGLIVLQQVVSLIDAFRKWPLFEHTDFYRFPALVSGLLLLLLLITILRSRSPIRSYLLMGNGFLIGLVVLPLLVYPYVEHLTPPLDYIVNYPVLWTSMGLCAELFCFAMALAYRGRLIELENRRMQLQHAAELKDKLAQRTAEVEAHSRQLQQQHLRQVELHFEQKLAESEMGALRAQMNPHFIFNCLNSIKLYATENESEKAAHYLTKFSRLIRLVLENSRVERVSLLNEMEALTLYLEMEVLRFEDKLSFSLDIEPDIDSEFIEIPPLLIQPYVENAIWHGLMHKREGGRVRVQVEQPQEDLLRITITDNGVGRARAEALKSKSASARKSLGMKVTSERIALINHLYQIETKVTVHDLVGGDGLPAGTEVVMEIPI